MGTQTPFGLPAIWLRDNCRCSRCWDPVTGERLVSITDLPPDVSVATSARSGDRIEIVFGPDGHQSIFDAIWLGQYAAVDEVRGGGTTAPSAQGAGRQPWDPAVGDDGRSEDSKRLWSAAEIASAFPQGSWPLFLGDVTHRQACLAAVLREGFVMLRDVAPEPGTLLTVARSIGFVRETEHGPIVDMQARPRPPNQVFTSQALTPRSGHAMRDPMPTVQLTHCISQADEGGETVLVDAFHAAATLRAEHPRAFSVLASTEVTFAFADAAADLRATRPVITTGPRGRIREIRFDSGLMQPLRMPPAEVVDFYDAYRAFATVIGRPSEMAAIRLRPGDCLVIDNTRVLVGRSSFTGTTQRHFQMCWADLDSLASTLAMMRRAGRNGHQRI